ncbi:hypothetical protein ACJ73_01557 [Blastomyces percursus]|uniref:Myb-like domain-containing protein n=1 Tax=Blastomyces percursus TaxID=1658174 RepID=A0A1J9R3U1_9EURO|nr:hypothetical protein ACJ73_01557 [Blastomyces percursus]
MPSPAPFSTTFRANFKPWALPHPKPLSSHKSLHSHSPAASCSPASKSQHDSPCSTLPPPSITSLQDHRLNTPSSESPEHGPSYPHDPAHLTPNSPRIAACNTQDPNARSDELPPLKGGAAGPGPSSPSTTSSDGSLEEFLRLPVLPNDNNIPIDPAILADDRPWETSELLPSFWQGNSPATPKANCPYPEPLPMFYAAPDHRSFMECSVDEGSSSEQSKGFKRGAERLEEQTMKQPQIASVLPTGKGSFTSVRSHFLSLQLDERLQFLSWLFEGALASCTPDFNESVQSVIHSDSCREIEPTRHNRKRKGHGDKPWRWSPKDDAQLLGMTEDRRPWIEIERYFPERTESALRQRQSTLRKQRNRRRGDIQLL